MMGDVPTTSSPGTCHPQSSIDAQCGQTYPESGCVHATSVPTDRTDGGGLVIDAGSTEDLIDEALCEVPITPSPGTCHPQPSLDAQSGQTHLELGSVQATSVSTERTDGGGPVIDAGSTDDGLAEVLGDVPATASPGTCHPQSSMEAQCGHTQSESGSADTCARCVWLRWLMFLLQLRCVCCVCGCLWLVVCVLAWSCGWV
jgi:hypothetical protein